MSPPTMDFCPRCGRYLKDEEYQCPECGNIVRQMPQAEQMPPELMDMYSRKEPFDLKKALFEKWFFISLAIAFAAAFLVTFYWRFTILFFCIPLFLPMRRLSIGAGVFVGLTGGSLAALLVKYYLFSSIV